MLLILKTGWVQRTYGLLAAANAGLAEPRWAPGGAEFVNTPAELRTHRCHFQAPVLRRKHRFLDTSCGRHCNMYKHNELDQRLLAMLRHNARESVATLAVRLGVSRTTVSNRISKLERDGVIVGYTVRLKPEMHAGGLQAWMSIAIEGNDTRRVTASLLGEPSVSALHATNGQWDLLAQLQVETLPALSAALERIRLIKGIRNSETSIHLESFRL